MLHPTFYLVQCIKVKMCLISKLRSRRVDKGTQKNKKAVGKLRNYIVPHLVEFALLCVLATSIYIL